MTKIMMTGANGRVGRELREYGVLPLSGNVTNPNEINDTVLREKPDIIVHLAALSNVDFCERPENKNLVIDVNLRGTYNVLSVAEQVGAKVVMLSTDHVFDGGKGFLHKRGPYKETDKPNPLNFYGNSKYSAEALQESFPDFYVVRTSYLFDWKCLGMNTDRVILPDFYPNFICRSFMYLPHFVSNLFMYLNHLSDMPKLFHISGSQTISWYDFMSLLIPNLTPRHKEYKNVSFAPRAKWAGLKTKYKNLLPSYSYLDGIEQMLDDRK